MRPCVRFPADAALTRAHPDRPGRADNGWAVAREIMGGIPVLFAYPARAGIPVVTGIPLLSADPAQTACAVIVPFMSEQTFQIHIHPPNITGASQSPAAARKRTNEARQAVRQAAFSRPRTRFSDRQSIIPPRKRSAPCLPRSTQERSPAGSSFPPSTARSHFLPSPSSARSPAHRKKDDRCRPR